MSPSSDLAALIEGVSWSDLAGGVLAGVIATAVWALGLWWVEAHRFERAFARLSGHHEVRRKQSSSLEPYTVVVTAKGSVLDVRYDGWRDGSCEGEIVMNRERRGAGHYSSVKKGKQLWGFWDVQVTDAGTVLVHEIYAKEETKTQIVSGYRWTRLPV